MLANEKLVNILGGHHVWTNIHGCQPCPGNCHLCTEISKRRTIIHTTVDRMCNINTKLKHSANFKFQIVLGGLLNISYLILNENNKHFDDYHFIDDSLHNVYREREVLYHMKFSPFFNQLGYLVCFMEKGQTFKIKLFLS